MAISGESDFLHREFWDPRESVPTGRKWKLAFSLGPSLDWHSSASDIICRSKQAQIPPIFKRRWHGVYLFTGKVAKSLCLSSILHIA